MYSKIFLPLLMVLVVLPGMAAEKAMPTAAEEAKKVLKKPEPKKDTPRIWSSAEYLLFWSKDGRVRTNLITGSFNQGSVGGRLTDGRTILIYGPSDLDYGHQSGGRATLGGWIDEGHQWGAELTGFALEAKTSRFDLRGSGADNSLELHAPFFSTNFGIEASTTISQNLGSPDFPGGVSISSRSQFWGLGAHGLKPIYHGKVLTELDLIFGFRHLNLSEDFQYEKFLDAPVGSNLFFANNVFAGPHQEVSKDSFETKNQFFGANIGARLKFDFGRVYVNVDPTIALGWTRETLEITGRSYLLSPTGALLTPAIGSGLYATFSNSGERTKNRFAFAPELKTQVGVRVNQRLDMKVGYNFLYLSNVVRPADQINHRINTQQVPIAFFYNPAALPQDPRPKFKTDDYFIHGLTVGFTLKF